MTLKTNLIAMALILVVGTPAAYLLATRRFRGRSLVITLLELPLVLPPAVAGIGLIAAFGRRGLLGGDARRARHRARVHAARGHLRRHLRRQPFYLRQAIASFEAVDRRSSTPRGRSAPGPARASGAWRCRSRPGGSAPAPPLAFARGLGEFGATIMFAGSLQGVTQTLPLAIYEQFDANFDAALAISALLVIVSVALLLAVKLVPAWTRFVSIIVLPLRAFRLELSARGRPRDARARRAVRRGQDDASCAPWPGSSGQSADGSQLGGETWFDSARRVDLPPERAPRRASSSRTTRSSRI